MIEASPTIRPRRVHFEWANTPRHWIPGDPFATHLMNVLHLLVPAGEVWFVRVYQEALPLIRDELLAAQVRGFMGQEAIHSRAHAAVLAHLREQGLETADYTRRIESMFDRLLGKRAAPRLLRRRWLQFRLATIAAIEHITCVLGNWILAAPPTLPSPESRGFARTGARLSRQVACGGVSYVILRFRSHHRIDRWRRP